MLSLDVVAYACHPNTLEAETGAKSCKFEGQFDYNVSFKPACATQNLFILFIRKLYV